MLLFIYKDDPDTLLEFLMGTYIINHIYFYQSLETFDLHQLPATVKL